MAGRAVARSQAERMWLIGGGLLALVVVLIGYFFFVGPQRDETSSLQTQADDARAQNSLLQTKINHLRAENVNLARYRTELATARKALPATSGLPDFLRTLQSLSSQTLTDVRSLNVGQPTDVSAVAEGKAADVAPSSAPTGNAAAAAEPAASAPKQVTTGAGVYGLEIQTVVRGAPGSLNRFLDQLQAVQPRAVLITSISEGTAAAEGKSGDAQDLQLTMLAFVAPSGAEQADLASATGR